MTWQYPAGFGGSNRREPRTRSSAINKVRCGSRLGHWAFAAVKWAWFCHELMPRGIRCGRRLAGAVRPFSGEWTPPRPATISRGDMLHNMERHGFNMIVNREYSHSCNIRAEYVITGSHFSMEPRWYMSGVAVMLCKSCIDWHLMLYLARTYSYVGLLHGVLEELAHNGREFEWPVRTLRQSGAEPVPTEPDTIREALAVYEC